MVEFKVRLFLGSCILSVKRSLVIRDRIENGGVL